MSYIKCEFYYRAKIFYSWVKYTSGNYKLPWHSHAFVLVSFHLVTIVLVPEALLRAASHKVTGTVRFFPLFLSLIQSSFLLPGAQIFGLPSASPGSTLPRSSSCNLPSLLPSPKRKFHSFPGFQSSPWTGCGCYINSICVCIFHKSVHDKLISLLRETYFLKKWSN